MYFNSLIFQMRTQTGELKELCSMFPEINSFLGPMDQDSSSQASPSIHTLLSPIIISIILPKLF